MEYIKMESSTKNYLIRLLENHRTHLRYSNLTPARVDYEYRNVDLATARLMGKEPQPSLQKDIEEINYFKEEMHL